MTPALLLAVSLAASPTTHPCKLHKGSAPAAPDGAKAGAWTCAGTKDLRMEVGEVKTFSGDDVLVGDGTVAITATKEDGVVSLHGDKDGRNRVEICFIGNGHCDVYHVTVGKGRPWKK